MRKSKTTFLAIIGLIIGFLLVFGQARIKAQSASDGFDPNANGHVYAFAVTPNGVTFVGGDFTSIGGQTRNYLAGFDANGSVYTFFNPNPNNIVNSIALQQSEFSGSLILVGGWFTQIGGQTRNHLARLGTNGNVDSNFNPNVDSIVTSIVVQPDGKILIGGLFFSVSGQARRGIARLNFDGSLDTTFNPSPDGFVNSIVIQPDGKILVSGDFSQIGGQARSKIARLNADGSLDTTFQNSNANEYVNRMAIQADGKIVVGGRFTQIGGQSRNWFARLNSDGSLDTTFQNPNIAGGSLSVPIVYSIVIQSDGKILIGGDFSSVGGTTRNNFARLNFNGTLDTAFNPNANGIVQAATIYPDGRILVGGEFTAIGGQTRNRIARIDAKGNLNTTFQNPNANVVVNSTVVQPDGKILVGGWFTEIGGQTTIKYLARLNADGTLDTTFNANLNNEVNSIVIQPDGKILIGGWFWQVGGQVIDYIARLNSDGTRDATFQNLGANNIINSIVTQPDGKILIGGRFTQIGGEDRFCLARLNSDGSLDSTFQNPNITGGISSTVNSIALQPDGRILIGGDFSRIGGQIRSNIGRLNSDGSLDSVFSNPSADSTVYSIAIESDGKILVGGWFTQIGGQTRNCFARLNSNGTIDSTFENLNFNGPVYSITLQSWGVLIGGSFTSISGVARNRIARFAFSGFLDSFNPNANDTVRSISLQPDGQVLVGGNFTQIGGQSRTRVARLTNNDPALQEFSATRTSVTWATDYSTPQPWRVNFELSTDGVNYTSLGTGVESFSSRLFSTDENGRLKSDFYSASFDSKTENALTTSLYRSWALSGLNLPTGQNLWIRARGFYRGGYQSGSETIIERVQNVFLPLLPTAASVQVSGRVTAKSRPVSGAIVYLTDARGETKQATTNMFGFYSFSEVETGQTVILSVSAKNYRFAPQVVFVTEDLNDLNFFAEP